MRPDDAAAPRRVADIDWDCWQPVDRATLLFVVERHRILLIRKKRGLGAGKINGPGGRIEAAESPLACARREVQEEIGVTVHQPSCGGELRFQFVDGYSIHVLVYRASGCSGVPHATAEADPLWTPLEAIPYEDMWEDDRLWLPLLLDGTPFSGRFVFRGEELLDHRLATGPEAFRPPEDTARRDPT